MEKLAGVTLFLLSCILGFSVDYAAAETWYIYEGQMPEPWKKQFGDVLYEATKYWEERFPGTEFYRTQSVDDADFALTWASQFEGTRLGYYTSDTNNDYGKPYVAISLGYMTGDSFQNKKFNLVDPEYALAITTHELGHAIGLGHSDDPSDIMYPTLEDYQNWLKEHPSKTTDSDDSIQPLQAKYLLYENKDYGFSIKYPATWQKDETLKRYEDNPNFITIVTFTNPSQIGAYTITFAENDSTYEGLDDQQFLNKLGKKMTDACSGCQNMEFVASGTITNTNGYKLYHTSFTMDNDVSDEGTLKSFVSNGIIPDGNDLWVLGFAFLSEDDFFQNVDDISQMSDSFTIFDYDGVQQTSESNSETIETSPMYETFTSDEHGFSIDYPKNWYVDDEIIREEGFINYVQFSPKYKGTTTFIDVYKILNDFEFRDISTEQYLEKMVSSLEKRCNNATYDNDNYVCSDFKELYSDTIVDDYGNTWHFATTNEHNVYSDGYETDTATILYEMPYGDDTWAIRIILDDDAFNQFNSADEVDDFIKTVTTSFVLTDTSSKPDTEDKPTPAKPVAPSTQSTPTTKTTDNGGGCLIATATFGSELAPQVQFLREIRDNTVLSTASGTSFMTTFNSFYYSFSPTVADLERQNPAFKEAVKITITPLLSTLSILNYVDIDSESEMLGYGIGIILLNVGMYFITPALIILKIKSKLRTNLA